MKTLKKYLSLLIIIGLGILRPLSAQDKVTVKVVLNDGVENEYVMNESDKIFYSEDEMFLVSQGNVVNVPLDEIRKVLFNTTVDIQEVDSQRIMVYPNPAKDKMMLYNIDENQRLTLYSLEGCLLMQKIVSENELIDLTNFSPGMYILIIGDKVTKIVKQ